MMRFAKISICINKFYSCLLAALLSGLIAGAQQGADSTAIEFLEEVIVSDSRIALKRENSGKAVIKINAAQLQREKGRTLPEVLNSVAGLELSGSRGRPGEVIGVFARGGRGRQVVIIIDGVRVTDPSSFSQEYDLRLLDLSEISTIEIVKGATSTLYGANAATAVIRITTKPASEKDIGSTIKSTLGTQNTSERQTGNLSVFRNNVMVSGSPGPWSYRASFGQEYSDGLSSIEGDGFEKDPTSRINTNVSLGWQPNKNFGLNVYGNLSKLNTEYDDAFSLTDADFSFISSQKRIGLKSSWNYGGGNLELNGAFSSYDSENFSAFPNMFKGHNYIIDLTNRLKLGERFYSLAGLNIIAENAVIEEEFDSRIVDPYINFVYTGPGGFNLNTGARLNTHSEYGENWVYSMNPSFLLKSEEFAVKFMAAYATSYITPSLTQLFGQFGANPELEPESNTTMEVGAEVFSGGALKASIVYFDRQEENFVFFDSQTFTYNNAENQIDAKGVEIDLQWNISRFISLQSNYSFTERRGDEAIRIPKHKGNARVNIFPSEKTTILVDYAFTGTRQDTDFTIFEEVELQQFSLLGISYQTEILPNKLNGFVRVDNILNKDYQEIIGYTTRGRNISVGFQLEL